MVSKFKKIITKVISEIRGLLFFGKRSGKFKKIGCETPKSYNEWVERNDRLTESDLSAMRAHLKDLPLQPKISIITPIYKTPIVLLRRAIESVQHQVYENWELCIADDASNDRELRATLEAYAALDTRIKLVFRNENGHISRASNEAAALATGEFIGLLDHDDELRPHALYMNIVELNCCPAAGLIYSDEDKIDIFGRRFNPYFKSDWNPELFTQQNFICHFTVIKRSIFEAVGGFRAGFEGSQDWDLFLRVTEVLAGSQIRHLPYILYHWRAIEGSTAQHPRFKPYALVAAQKALQEHFHRTREAVTVDIIEAISQCRIRYHLPSLLPLISLIIPTRDSAASLERCVEKIIRITSYRNYEIIIIDNGSVEEATFACFQRLQLQCGQIRVIRDDSPFNFSALNNRAAKQARGSVLGFVNNDVEIINADWLCEMVGHVLRPGTGAVGARLWFPDNRLQHGGVILGIGGTAGHSHKGMSRLHFGYFNRGALAQNFAAVTAACLLVRKEVFEQVGGFDEISLAVAFNDVDFCLKVRDAGYWNVWTPYAEAYHYESLTRGYEDSPEKLVRFERESATLKSRWHTALSEDPAYNPNLTLQSEDFKFAKQTRVSRPWMNHVAR
jgi:GT2 family glycosyltransferase